MARFNPKLEEEKIKLKQEKEKLRHEKKTNKTSERKKASRKQQNFERKKSMLREKGNYQAKLNESSAATAKHKYWSDAAKVAFGADAVAPDDGVGSLFVMPNQVADKPQPVNDTGNIAPKDKDNNNGNKGPVQ
jgi:Na+-translocating ferredoxin:NAD+ oxidoreductase RnfC subunit